MNIFFKEVIQFMCKFGLSNLKKMNFLWLYRHLIAHRLHMYAHFECLYTTKKINKEEKAILRG